MVSRVRCVDYIDFCSLPSSLFATAGRIKGKYCYKTAVFADLDTASEITIIAIDYSWSSVRCLVSAQRNMGLDAREPD